MNDTGVVRETEVVYRRLNESLTLGGSQVDPRWWLAVLIPILVIGIAYVIWMYTKDSRSVRWFWALPLAALRIAVYLLIGYMFLLPARQTWETVEKKSRVLVMLDLSDSMAKISDDYAKPSDTRLNKVLDVLSDEQIGFMKRLLDKNPVYIYRFGNRLDDEPAVFEKRTVTGDGTQTISYVPYTRSNIGQDGLNTPEYGEPWNQGDWQAFTSYDLKPWILRDISEQGRTLLTTSGAWGKAEPGNAAWSRQFLAVPEAEIYPEGMTESDRAALKAARNKLESRAELAASLAGGTNLPESVLSAVNRESGNMVQGVVVFSDGRNTFGSDDAAAAELRARCSRDGIPVFTLMVGEDRPRVVVRVTDVQAPDQTPPDEPFKVIVEVDGEGLSGKELPVTVELTPPGDGVPHAIETKVTINPGEPPHGQVEVVIDPKTLPDSLKNAMKGPQSIIEGEWKVNARVPRQTNEVFKPKEHAGEAAVVRVEKKPLRILLFSSGPSRDFQFLLNQMLRDKADVSVFLQNEAGTKGKLAMLDDPNRALTHFPDRFKVEDDGTGKPEDKWYNLALYDVIIAFDPDWTQLTEEEVQFVSSWVDLQAGGIVFVAGPLYTKQLARTDDAGKMRPILDLLPVVPGDNDLARIKRNGANPFRVTFPNIGPEEEYLKLDEELPNGGPTAGWDSFFQAKENPGEGAKVVRGFHSYYPLEAVKAPAKAVALYSDPDSRMKDGKPTPYMVAMKFGQGRTVFIGSGESWRLRSYNTTYFERFWTKLTRYVSEGSRRKQDRRGRVLMSKDFPSGSYIRVTAQLLDASLKFLPPSVEPKVTITPTLLDDYKGQPPEAEHKRLTKRVELKAKKGTQQWEGYFAAQILASADQYPPGQWRMEIAIPNSSQKLIQKFAVRPSNPETDNTRPDPAALAAVSSGFDELKQMKDSPALKTLGVAARDIDSSKLAFKAENRAALEAIPEVIQATARTERNRGATEDLWDKGIDVPRGWTSSISDKQYTIAIWMLVAIGLLSVEWLIRKLLKLA